MHSNTRFTLKGRLCGRSFASVSSGYGRMGRGFVAAMQQSDYWDIAAICDVSAASRDIAAKNLPGG